jgi:hypothetical protein
VKEEPVSEAPTNAADETRTAQSLKKSLESTCAGLSALLESLERSGFRGALSPYQQLQLVLVQQRLWSKQHRRDELDPLWQKISEMSGRIHAILASFASVMEKLKSLDRVEAARAEPPAETPVQDNRMGPLADSLLEQYWILPTKLNQELQSQLREAAASGLLVTHGWGKSRSYRLAPEVREKLRVELTKLLESAQKQS